MEEILETVGESFVSFVAVDFQKPLRCIGSSVQGFFDNLDGFHGHILSAHKSKEMQLPAMRCSKNGLGHYTIHVQFQKTDMKYFLAGLIRGICKHVLEKDTHVNVENTNVTHEYRFTYNISERARKCSLCKEHHCGACEDRKSNPPRELGMKVMTFCSSFPFHFILDKKLQIVQLGTSLMRIIATHLQSKGSHFGTYFDLIKPTIHMTFSAFLSRINTTFELVSKVGFTSNGETISQVRIYALLNFSL